MTNVGLNFSSQNANKKVTLNFGKDNFAKWTDEKGKTVSGSSIEVQLDKNGTVTLNEVVMSVTAKNFSNPAIVNWLSATTNAVVNSGNFELYAHYSSKG